MSDFWTPVASPVGDALASKISVGVQVGRAGRQSLMGETPIALGVSPWEKTALAPQRTGSF